MTHQRFVVTNQRHGMTLVELMVVIVVLVLLVSITTSMLQPLLADREIREAARQVNAYIAGAPARAAETGYPAGIWLERSASNANAALDIFFAEVPPLFAGDSSSSAAVPTTYDNTSGTGVILLQNTATPHKFIRAGDRIRLNYQGPAYRVISVTGMNVSYATDGEAPPVDYGFYGGAKPYQVFRGPRKSSVSPLEMPGSTCVDLSLSGFGAAGTEFGIGGTDPVVITFSSDGGLDRVYVAGVATRSPQNVHLLVGTLGKVGVYTEPFDTDDNGTPDDGAPLDPVELSDNHADRNNRWVSIGHQTGTVITTENMAGTITDARQFAVSGQGMGGR